MQESLIQSPSFARRENEGLFSARSILLAVSATLGYLLLSYVLIGFKTDQLVLAGIFNFFFFASRPTRRFILGFSIFIVYWIIFDYMKAFPNYRYNEVHIASLYHAEKGLFGINWHNGVLTPNEFFARNVSMAMDIAAGLFYLCWVPVPLIFASVMFFKNRNAFFQFSLTFFLVNLIGFIGYYIYPAAPPWYVAANGFDFHAATPGNTAGLGRFDHLFGISVFKNLYAKSSNVFAAMPSLHAAYMMIVLFYGLKFRLKAWNALFVVIMLGIWFSAVYSGHHYILDILAGMGCAVVGISLFQWWIRTRAGGRLMDYLLAITEK
ncbi:phosphatase PAP2 family protein [Flavisolibacter nicotianae]|uniref:phosphatase PAP2 family protein n=1 Tax=Flavisolibacter nicotianae TaxID=2364882 RepID=UPI000EAFD0E6|nr:phosphatase PAP2 family protein [Flavisolibacter nicotianae]